MHFLQLVFVCSPSIRNSSTLYEGCAASDAKHEVNSRTSMVLQRVAIDPLLLTLQHVAKLAQLRCPCTN
jgi:hypothetical protein